MIKKGDIMRQKISVLVALAVAIGFSLYTGFMGIKDLVDTGSVESAKVTGAKEIVDLERRFYGIPVGHQHYFLTVNDDGEAYIVMADTKWGEKNFDDDGLAINKDGCKVKGLVKEVDKDIESEISSQERLAGILAKLTYPIGELNYIDVHYVRTSVLRIVAALVSLVIVAAGVFLLRCDLFDNKLIKALYFIIALVDFVWALTLIQ